MVHIIWLIVSCFISPLPPLVALTTRETQETPDETSETGKEVSKYGKSSVSKTCKHYFIHEHFCLGHMTA